MAGKPSFPAGKGTIEFWPELGRVAGFRPVSYAEVVAAASRGFAGKSARRRWYTGWNPVGATTYWLFFPLPFGHRACSVDPLAASPPCCVVDRTIAATAGLVSTGWASSLAGSSSARTVSMLYAALGLTLTALIGLRWRESVWREAVACRWAGIRR
jgi:hypothetical protein